MTIQVVLLVGLIVAHVTPAIKEDPLNCTYPMQCFGSGSELHPDSIRSVPFGSRRAKMTPKNLKKVKKFLCFK